MSSAITIRIPDKLASQLFKIVQETEQPTSYHIQKALEAYLEDFSDKQIALDRLQNMSDEIISFDELKYELEL